MGSNVVLQKSFSQISIATSLMCWWNSVVSFENLPSVKNGSDSIMLRVCFAASGIDLLLCTDNARMKEVENYCQTSQLPD